MTRSATLAAALMAGFQAILWAKVQFWVGMAAAALLAVALAWIAVRLRPRVSVIWPLFALLSVLCFLPIRAGALQSRLLERVAVAVLACMALLGLLMAIRSVLGAVMRRPALRKPVLLLAGFVVLALLLADLLQWVRPSGLSAVACTTTLFRGNPDTRLLLDLHRDAIINQAALRDLPGALVAAVMVDHQNQQTVSGDLSDCLGSALGVNLSLGLAQVRLSTAALVDGRLLMKLSAREYRSLRARLLDPDSNIAYEAGELRALMERPGRFPGMDATSLLHDPAAMALLISEYRSGRKPTATSRSRLSINAFSTLGLMLDSTLGQFDRPEQDPSGARALIREYLHQIYCQSGRFNRSACKGWE